MVRVDACGAGEFRMLEFWLEPAPSSSLDSSDGCIIGAERYWLGMLSPGTYNPFRVCAIHPHNAYLGIRYRRINGVFINMLVPKCRLENTFKRERRSYI
jgi:hypothetical protein